LHAMGFARRDVIAAFALAVAHHCCVQAEATWQIFTVVEIRTRSCAQTSTGQHFHVWSCNFAALCAIVDLRSRAIATRSDSFARIRALALAVAAAVVCLAWVRVFAALCAIVDLRSRAIATRSDSFARIRALALAVAAAVVCLAWVNAGYRFALTR